MVDVEELRALIDQLEKVFVHGESGFVPYDKLIAGMREALAAQREKDAQIALEFACDGEIPFTRLPEQIAAAIRNAP